ncbi:hypothetical protein BA3_0037 [Thalassomonas phage BA3]|uniref:hypothetical protein n=1 Tax=Thalassomonas phage BA3 TaxID=469660 RepID=UPI00015D95B4|nr:hypothetical protein BA3_0037 [Thalassomonas phage BA3]ABV74322.1 hypothetical protein BA3_0037 [Thalassomonas phage BA3]
MTENDGNKFKELITAINVTYGEEFTQPQTLLWWNMFKPYPIEAFEQAVYQHMADPDQGMFSPKPANIMKFITGTTKQNEQALEDKAELAWHVIEGEIRRIGSYGSLKMEDKQALAAVQALGGWKHLCGLTTDQMVWAHKEFIAAYQNYERTPAHALPDKLPGRVALENHKAEQSQGLKHITDGIQNYRNRKGIENNG